MKRIFKALAGAVLSLSILVSMMTPSFAYTVKSGDTLSRIATELGTTVDKLKEINGIEDINHILTGQELITEEVSDSYKRIPLTDSVKKAILSLFDVDYYKENNSDVVAEAGDSKEALEQHFLKYGLWETRQPNADFNVNAYASAYDDLSEAFKNENTGKQVVDLYLHYVGKGREEGRTTSVAGCLSRGKNVLYYGAYDDETAPTEQLSVLASPKASAPAAEKLTYVKAARQASLAILDDLASLYTKWRTPLDSEYWITQFFEAYPTTEEQRSNDTYIATCMALVNGMPVLNGAGDWEEDYAEFYARTNVRMSNLLKDLVTGVYDEDFGESAVYLRELVSDFPVENLGPFADETVSSWCCSDNGESLAFGCAFMAVGESFDDNLFGYYPTALPICYMASIIWSDPNNE